MILKGTVSSIESSGARIILPYKNNTVSPPLKIVEHVGNLIVGDNVIVAFFSSNITDGVVIGKY